jgi:hypothetical protein
MKQLIKFLARANEAEIMELTFLMEAETRNQITIQNLLKRYE